MTRGVAPGEVIAGKYQVESTLGAGGMGFVVSARHLELEERVALKFMNEDALGNRAASERFVREARSAVRLKSEHVCRVYDVGRTQAGLPFIVMEYLEGLDLGQVLQRHGHLPLAVICDYVAEACEAMAEAHALGIVHRDLKPANLFLTCNALGTPMVKVLDFGIAKAENPGAASGDKQLETHVDAMMGSPPFMSPEQVRSAKRVDARSDIWSLGVILYQLYSGRLPFEGESSYDTGIRVLSAEPPPLAVNGVPAPPEFEAVVRRCLAKAPDQRYATANELRLALLQVAERQRVAVPADFQRILSQTIAPRVEPTRPPPSGTVDATGTAHPRGNPHAPVPTVAVGTPAPAETGVDDEPEAEPEPTRKKRSRVWQVITIVGPMLIGPAIYLYVHQATRSPRPPPAVTPRPVEASRPDAAPPPPDAAPTVRAAPPDAGPPARSDRPARAKRPPAATSLPVAPPPAETAPPAKKSLRDLKRNQGR